MFTKARSQREKSDIFSYKTAFYITKEKHPFTEGENIIKPSLHNFYKISGETFAKKLIQAVNEVPLSNNTIKQCIQSIAVDLKEQILED